jgi:glycosyltransferase involved in cell wall biosynthesis
MRVILQNQEDLAFFTGHGLAPTNTMRLVRGSGVDISAFRPHPRQEQPPVILQTSRMLADKGVREFIAAAREVKKRWPLARFLLVGPLYPGNPSALSEEELRAAEREGVIQWLGYRSDIAELLANATIFCLPSYREGLPKSVLEAAACGLPIVTTDTSGCREVVSDGENGLLVPIGDAQALAGAIERLLSDSAFANRLGQRARERVEREFALDFIIDQQIALYAEPNLRQSG